MSVRSPYSREHLSVELAGRSVRVPYRPAVEWIDAVSVFSGPTALLASMVSPEDQSRILDSLAVGTLPDGDLADASYALLKEAVPAFDWWESYRLLDLSTERVTCGRCAVAGLDPHELTVAQWCSAVYALVRDGVSEKDLFKFDAALSAVPEGVEDDGDWGSMSFDQAVTAARTMPGFG
jgi:hypothetical protein